VATCSIRRWFASAPGPLVAARHAFISDFYRCDKGAYVLGHKTLRPDQYQNGSYLGAYVILQKAANNLVRANLAHHGPTSIIARTANGGVQMAFDHSTREQLEWLARSIEMPRPQTFTFARSPLERFLSGYAEAAWRTHNQHCRTQHACGSGNATWRITTEQARAFVSALLEADHEQLADPRTAAGHAHVQLDHAFPMAGALVAWHPLDFVGHLETIEHDWGQLTSRFPWLRPKKLDVNLAAGQHLTSADPIGARQAMRQVLDEQPEYARALCVLLAPDAFCFGYFECGGRPLPRAVASLLRSE
jgi:hypothetical protein